MESMKRLKVAIIGGGASGLMLAAALPHDFAKFDEVAIFERGDRLGKKLSATGNGQGNITNLAVREGGFSSLAGDAIRAQNTVNAYDNTVLQDFFAALGVPLLADERGRVYPAGRQASALCDALRFTVEKQGVSVYLQSQVTEIKKEKDGFLLRVATKSGEEKYFAKTVVLCAGGKAAKNFGTDGTAYALAQNLGHSVTALYPSLVQLKTDTAHIKTLKGIRVHDGMVRAYQNGKLIAKEQGDIIFTDYGISGDAVFRISAYLTDKVSKGISLELDFLPEISETEIYRILQEKEKKYPTLSKTELLFGVVNNQIGRAILRRADGDMRLAAKLTKAFPLSLTGNLGFEYAQVTKGGIPLCEADENLESRFVKGLYFAGEILDVDGACGGYNLQWAFSSSQTVAKALIEKRVGQV
ncbi:MAG: aminoacetone oxidase family FAD-binding enzyme [Clostridiales bacterium]|nr:aminoacetone oxidase family FAD-binding enzyme [Clostridiales bacterium]